jgi:hypothetical protein
MVGKLPSDTGAQVRVRPAIAAKQIEAARDELNDD